MTCRLNQAIQEEIAILNRTHVHPYGEALTVRGATRALPVAASRWDLYVYFSDVDELLDAEALKNFTHRLPGCMGVRQKVFMYNERCFMKGTR